MFGRKNTIPDGGSSVIHNTLLTMLTMLTLSAITACIASITYSAYTPFTASTDYTVYSAYPASTALTTSTQCCIYACTTYIAMFRALKADMAMALWALQQKKWDG